MPEKLTSDKLMNIKNELAKIDVMILCGGLGTRLRPISEDLPKVLMPFAGRPFIDVLIESLLPFGFRRFVLCVGHLKEKVRAHFQERDYEIVFSEEEELLGTGGALKNASIMITGKHFLVMNGDSICPVDFSHFYDFHIQNGGIASLVLVEPLPGQDYGVVKVDDHSRIISFKEKKECREKMLINGGIYFMNREILDDMPAAAKFSLEYDLFPKIISKGCYGFIVAGEVIDIGTPERYLQALKKLSFSNQNG
jgi:NDP-sugar pyrophosphorylase family protein